jgi:hypothetical protein
MAAAEQQRQQNPGLQSLKQGRIANPMFYTVIGLANSLMVPVIELIDCIAINLETVKSR